MDYDFHVQKVRESLMSNNISEINRRIKNEVLLILKENSIKDGDIKKRVVVIDKSKCNKAIYIDGIYYCSVKSDVDRESKIQRYYDNKMPYQLGK